MPAMLSSLPRFPSSTKLADLCELVGADVKEVAAGMGYDARIGRHFLDAGLGWGGSCFPKGCAGAGVYGKGEGTQPAHFEPGDGCQL